MPTITHVNPESLHHSPAFTQAVRVPAGHDLVFVGGQNGVGPDGVVVGPGIAEQTARAMANLRTCLEAAGAEPAHVVKWTIIVKDGASIEEGYAAFQDWPRDVPPPAITVAVVAALGPPGAVVEIEAVAAVPPAR